MQIAIFKGTNMNSILQPGIKLSSLFNKQKNINEPLINKENSDIKSKPIEKQKPKFGISEEDYKRAAQTLGCSVETIKAFAKVESRGKGFNDDGTPVILFERHIFNRLLKKKGLSCDDKSICATNAGGYVGGKAEHSRLAKAVLVDRESALQSASWGAFQVMAFNWKACGYESLQSFINAAYRSESDHLDMFVGFIKSNSKLLQAIRNKDWATAARIYNGPGYKKNNYDVKLAQAYSEEITRNLV